VKGRLRNVIIVTGTPGTGKTILSRALAKAIGARYVNLTQFVSKRGLYSEIDRERRTKIVDLARTRSSLMRELGTTNGPVVVDTHVLEGIVPGEMVRRVIVLRCHPKVLEARLQAKKWKPDKIRENVLAEILDSCLTAAVKQYGRRKVIQLDTSRGSVPPSVDMVRRSIVGKCSRRISVNWLARLEKEGLLDRYLRR
jgi:adenylate kinase